MSEDYQESTNRIKYDAAMSQEISDSRRDAAHEARDRRTTRKNKIKNAGRTALVMLGIGSGVTGGVLAAEAALDGQREKNDAVVHNTLKDANDTPQPLGDTPIGPNPAPVNPYEQGQVSQAAEAVPQVANEIAEQQAAQPTERKDPIQ